jgi:hypothetical protein
LEIGGKALPGFFAEAEIKRGMGLEVIARNTWICVGESRRVVTVDSKVGTPGERVLSAEMQRMPLVMVDLCVMADQHILPIIL